LLEGKTVNLRQAGKDDISLIAEWWRDPQYMGEHQDVMTISMENLRKVMFEGTIFFIVERKGGTKIGHINVGCVAE